MSDDPAWTPSALEPAPVRARRGRTIAGRPLGTAMAGLWIVYLAPLLQDAWELPDLARRLAAVSVVVAFGAWYVSSFWVQPLAAFSPPGSESARGTRRAGVVTVVGVLLAAAGLLLLGRPALGMTPFLLVLVLFVFRGRTAWILWFVVFASAEGIALLVPGWGFDPDRLSGELAASFAVMASVALVQRNVMLRRARGELAESAVAEERARMSRDLHDLLGHTLTVITLKAELAGRLLDADPERARAEIGDVERLTRQALAEVRATVAGSHEASVARELVSARLALIAAGVEAELPATGDEVPEARQELCAWVIREGVTNVVRHAAARRCRVLLEAGRVRIEDDGRGVGPRDARGGRGLSGLRERAARAGAAVSVGRSPWGGWALEVSWA